MNRSYNFQLLYADIRDGIHVATPGTATTRNITNSIHNTNGSTAFPMRVTLAPLIDEATKRHTPTGGVSVPMTTFIRTITPNVIGDTPTEAMTGINIGTNISISARPSINIPPIRKIMFMSRTITSLLLLILSIRLVTAAGKLL